MFLSGFQVRHIKFMCSNMKTQIILCFLTLTTFSICLGRNATYRPPKLENCTIAQDCRGSCDRLGKKFCGFNGYSDHVSYTGCIPHEYAKFCCNSPTENHKDCGKETDGLTEACNAEKYGEWLYMDNTEGTITCRHKSDHLIGGTIVMYKNYKMNNVEQIICEQPRSWCRDGVQHYVNGSHFSWSCLDHRSKCREVGEISHEHNYNVFTISGVVGVIAMLLSAIGIFSFCKWRRRRKAEMKKEVIDDNFYYGEEGEEGDYYHQSHITDKNDYYESSIH